jgi:putative SOS response-associated peptidase YedK
MSDGLSLSIFTIEVVRNVGTERELTMMRWGMPPPPQFGGPPVTNIRNTSSRTGGAG